jgi:hypothetical protein
VTRPDDTRKAAAPRRISACAASFSSKRWLSPSAIFGELRNRLTIEVVASDLAADGHAQHEAQRQHDPGGRTALGKQLHGRQGAPERCERRESVGADPMVSA